MKHLDREAWADAACRGIVSKKEQSAVRQELLDHMEDHAEALMSAGLSKEEALEQACLAMGDPEAVGKLLRKTHQPVLSRILLVCRWTIIGLAVLLVFQLFTAVFSQRAPLEYLWCGDPLQYFGYFQTETLGDGILAKRVVDVNGSAVIGDYTVRVTKVALDRTAEGSDAWFLLVMKPKHIWQGAPLLRGTVTCTAGEETASRQIFSQSYHRNLNRHYLVALGRFEGDILESDAVTLTFTNGENGFSIPLKLEGGDIHEK